MRSHQRFGPNPRTPYRPAASESRKHRPDTRLHLITCSFTLLKTSCIERGIHTRLLQSTPPTLSTGLEKPRRLRTEGGLNEHLGRHKSVTGPIGISERKECYSESLPWWTKRIEILKQIDPKLVRNLFSQEWRIVCPSIEYDPQCHVDKMISVIFNYEKDKIES